MVVLADPVRGCVCRSELTFFTLCHTLKLDSLLKGQIHLYIHLWIQSNIVSREVSVQINPEINRRLGRPYGPTAY